MRNKKVSETFKFEFVGKEELWEQLESFIANLGGYTDKNGNATSIYHGEITVFYMMEPNDVSKQKVIDEEE